MKIYCILLLLLSASFDAIAVPGDPEEKTLAIFTDFIVGRYTNTKQYTANAEDRYHMQMTICSIWEKDEITEGKWFYIEHAMYSMAESPIRQFIWNVNTIDENTIRITFYEIQDKKQYANTCRGELNNAAFDNLTKRDLIQHDGCDLILIRTTDSSFEGKMGGFSCETDEGAGKFLRSDIKVSRREIQLKDQGFKEDGTQVWGPADYQLPYIYKKVSM